VPPTPFTAEHTRVPRSRFWVCYLLLGGLFSWAILSRSDRCVVFSDAIGVEAAQVGRVEQRIDPNTAPWAELARLPGIGEVLAKRIVGYREAHRARLGSGPEPPAVFLSLEDLRPIPGIGEKKLKGLADRLRLPRPARAGQD